MFQFFSKKRAPQTAYTQVVFSIAGMHCSSCSITIDDALEETPGVIRASTNFAKAKTAVTYDPVKVTQVALQAVIEDLKYQATEVVKS